MLLRGSNSLDCPSRKQSCFLNKVVRHAWSLGQVEVAL